MPSRNELVVRANAVGITPSNYPNDSKLEQKVLYMEKFGTTYTETLGTGVFTIAGADVAAADTITIGNRIYTFVTALTGAKASSTLTSNATAPADGDTVSIGSLTYTFRTALSSPAQSFEVLIGGTAAIALDNLKLAINKGATEGTQYSFGTYAHPDVTAEANADTTQEVTARQYGTASNNIPTVDVGATLSWDGTTLGGAGATAGVNVVPDQIKIQASAAVTLDVLKDAINGTAVTGVLGTDFSSSIAHDQVTGTTNTNTAQTVVARNAAFDNASIAISATGSGNIAAGAATLASGVRGVIAANTTTYAGSAGISGDKNLV